MATVRTNSSEETAKREATTIIANASPNNTISSSNVDDYIEEEDFMLNGRLGRRNAVAELNINPDDINMTSILTNKSQLNEEANQKTN
jgi:hypothetical protein